MVVEASDYRSHRRPKRTEEIRASAPWACGGPMDQGSDVVQAHGISLRIRVTEKNSLKGPLENHDWHAHCQTAEKNKKGNKVNRVRLFRLQ
jgi:hypothetical protein